MQIKDRVAIVSGGASGLGRATAISIVNNGGKVAILDLNEEKGNELSLDYTGKLKFYKVDVTDEKMVKEAVEEAESHFSSVHFCINCAGIAPGSKVYGSKGIHDLNLFKKVIEINLIGSFNVLRICAESIAKNTPNSEGERGVIINTASIAAFDGQIGQVAYAASKGGIASMTLPIARDLSKLGIRCMSIAPGLFHTPLFDGLPDQTINSLSQAVPFPSRLGNPWEFAMLIESIIKNPMLNGEVIRLDGALRMPPK